MSFTPRPYNKPTSLVRTDGERVALRIESEQGDRMATYLRPLRLRDALAPPRFRRGR